MPATRPVTVIHGSTRHPETAALLRNALEKSELDRTLIIGYPPQVDAVLVSGQGHVTVFHLDPDGAEDPVDRQHRAWTCVDRLLRLKPEFRRGRQPLITPQSVTVTHAAGANSDLADPAHPIATHSTVLDVIRSLHHRPPPDPPANHDAVVDQILWIPPVL